MIVFLCTCLYTCPCEHAFIHKVSPCKRLVWEAKALPPRTWSQQTQGAQFSRQNWTLGLLADRNECSRHTDTPPYILYTPRCQHGANSPDNSRCQYGPSWKPCVYMDLKLRGGHQHQRWGWINISSPGCHLVSPPPSPYMYVSWECE